MKEIIEKYINYSMGDHYTDRLDDTKYEIEDYDYYLNFNVNDKHGDEETIIIGFLTENLVKLFVNEYSYIDEEMKYYRKNEIEFCKEEDTIKYKKNIEDRINYYDEEGLLRSKLEKENSETKYIKLEDQDLRKNLLSDIKITKTKGKIKSL